MGWMGLVIPEQTADKSHRKAVLINTEIDCLNPFINFLHDFTLIVIEMKWNMTMFGFLYVS